MLSGEKRCLVFDTRLTWVSGTTRIEPAQVAFGTHSTDSAVDDRETERTIVSADSILEKLNLDRSDGGCDQQPGWQSLEATTDVVNLEDNHANDYCAIHGANG